MTPYEIVQYYANLLIVQYITKPKAYATIAATVAPLIMPMTTIQQVSFSSAPVSGTFIFQYDGVNTAAINWNDSSATIQSKLQAIPALASVTVVGDIVSDQQLTITFTGVAPPAQPLLILSNALLNVSSQGIQIDVLEIDQTLPLAIQDAFNITGSNPAVGVQLDTLGQYAGVTRYGNGPNGPITLDDADFLTFLKFAIVQNSSGSSLATIEANLNKFFPGQFIVTDYRNMYLSYLLSASLGSANLFALLVAEKLIPKPMGVGLSVIIPPDINAFFGFSTYDGLNNLVKPFNTYDAFNTSWLFLSYSDAAAFI